MSKKYNIKYISKKYTKEDIINETVPHNDIEEAQGYKPTSPQATGRRNQGHKPRVQASSLSVQAPGSGNQGTSGSPQASGHKQPV